MKVIKWRNGAVKLRTLIIHNYAALYCYLVENTVINVTMKGNLNTEHNKVSLQRDANRISYLPM